MTQIETELGIEHKKEPMIVLSIYANPRLSVASVTGTIDRASDIPELP